MWKLPVAGLIARGVEARRVVCRWVFITYSNPEKYLGPFVTGRKVLNVVNGNGKMEYAHLWRFLPRRIGPLSIDQLEKSELNVFLHPTANISNIAPSKPRLPRVVAQLP